MRLALRNDLLRLNQEETDWANPEGLVPLFVAVTNVSQWRYTGQRVPFDYEIRFSDQIQSRSLGGFRLGSRGPEAVETDCFFEVINTTENRPAEFVFLEPDPEFANGMFDANEFFFIYETIDNEPTPTWAIRIDSDEGGFPSAGDVFQVKTFKPFVDADLYSYSTFASSVSAESAQDQLDQIRVVPNPYVAAASWESRLPPTITSGRGERRVDFVHLPAQATISIYSSRGELVQTLEHDGNIADGSVTWDLKTREGLDVAFGVYFYHVEAPGIGETRGKLAIIK